MRDTSMEATLARNAKSCVEKERKMGFIEGIVERLQATLCRIQNIEERNRGLADRLVGPVSDVVSNEPPMAPADVVPAFNTVYHVSHMVDEINSAISDAEHEFDRLNKL